MGEVRMNVPRVRKIKGRFYWWPTPATKKLGFHSEALGADPVQAAARARQLNEQVERERRGALVPKETVENVKALIALYRQDAAFTSRKQTTQKGYNTVLNEIERKEGHVLVRTITKKQLKSIYRELMTRGIALAGLHMRIWRLLLAFAEEEGWIEANPGKKLRIVSTEARTIVWTWPQIDAFCKAADAEKVPSMALAVMLAYDLGQRQGDILALSKAAKKGAGFLIRQSKTDEVVLVPLRWRETRKRLAAAPKSDAVQVVISEATGLPYKADHFRHEFARIKKLAGLPDELQYRDLRRTAATEQGDGGADTTQIRSVTGHRSDAMLRVYVRPTGTQAAAAQKARKRTKGQPR